MVRFKNFWGMASEQPIENLHAVVNRDLKRFCAITNKEVLYMQIASVKFNQFI